MKKKDKKFYQMFSVNKHNIDEYDEWNKKRYDERNSDNIFPIGMTDKEFAHFIRKMFLGDDWYVNYPAGSEQINEEALEEIIYKFTHRNPKERDELRNKLNRS